MKTTYSNLSDYERMVCLVSKNKKIPALMRACETNEDHVDNIEQLRQAINDDNPADEVFSDSNCMIYVMFLLKNKEITADESITLFMYISVLMRYSEKPVMPDNYLFRKAKTRNIEVVTGKNREFVRKYANAIITHSKQSTGVKDKIQPELEAYPSCSPTRLEWFIILPMADEMEQFLDENDATMNFFVTEHTPFSWWNEDSKNLVIPPMSVRAKFYREINNQQQFKTFPILGTFSTRTLFMFHAEGLHPINFLSPFIKNNLKELHGDNADLVNVPYHDVDIHGYAGCTYLPYEHSLIFKYIIPTLEKLIVELPVLSDLLSENLSNINDLDQRSMLETKQERISRVIRNSVTNISPNTSKENCEDLFKSYIDKVKALRADIYNDCGVTIDDFIRELSRGLEIKTSTISSIFSTQKMEAEDPKVNEQIDPVNMLCKQ